MGAGRSCGQRRVAEVLIDGAVLDGDMTGDNITLTGEIKAETGWLTKTPGANVVQLKLGDGDSGIGESGDDQVITVIAGTERLDVRSVGALITGLVRGSSGFSLGVPS